jgi:hypothetical protein
MRWAGIVLVVVVGMYMYTLISTTMMVAEKRSLESDMKQMASNLSEAEVTYMRVAELWSPDDIAEYGFHTASRVHFVEQGVASTHVAYANR